MNRTAQILRGAFMSALLFASIPATAQTFFGAGGTTNTAASMAGGYNVGLGYGVLTANTTGTQNTANGYNALNSNTTGTNNTANGYQALYNNTTGLGNTANGVYSLYSNTTGWYNTANGAGALQSNTTGWYNTATGSQALSSNTTGTNNTANGYAALFYNTTGGFNVSDGYYAMKANTTAAYNVAVGVQSLYKNTTGSSNVAIGYKCLYNTNKGKGNIAIGFQAGYNLTSGSNNIDIGNLGVAADSGAIRIGTTGTHTSAFIAGINGSTASSGVAVYIDANGQLGTVTSSRRFKKDIQSMGSVSDKLLQLRPVTFRYKAADETGAHPIQYGLIAEEVAKVFPDLVQYDKAGKPFTVRYHLLTPMLLNELQKANRREGAHKSEVTSLKAQVSTLTAKLASMEQAQAEQKRLLNQLAAYIQNGKKNATTEKANFVQH